jgi:hypothetical protein
MLWGRNLQNLKMPLVMVKALTEKIRKISPEVGLLSTILPIGADLRVSVLIKILLGQVILTHIPALTRNIPALPHILHLTHHPRDTPNNHNWTEDISMIMIMILMVSRAPIPVMAIIPPVSRAPGVQAFKITILLPPDLVQEDIPLDMMIMIRMRWSMSIGSAIQTESLKSPTLPSVAML